MIPLFLGLTLANWVGLLAVLIMGYLAGSRGGLGQWHMLGGVLAAILCCAVHCVVFTYFVATAKWIQHAIRVKGLDPALAAPTRSFKAQALPAALAAMIMVFATAVVGALVDSYGSDVIWHHVVALATIAVNVIAAVIELLSIRRNGALVDRVLELANAPATRPKTVA